MRILIVDDDPATDDRYARCFEEAVDTGHGIGEAAPVFSVACCRAAADAAPAIDRARQADQPYSVAILDLRDGERIEAARAIRALDPDVNLVIVTGDRNFLPRTIARVAGPIEKIFYIAKPFEPAEVRQTAIALARRWQADRDLKMARAQLRIQVLQLREQQQELAAKEARSLHLAMHDSLTGAPNRLAFLHALEARVERPGTFAVAMIDLDRFKLVNDTLGHLAGDALIRAVCAVLRGAAPADALVARLGGDEFGILFDSPDAASALAVCDALVAACAIPHVVLGHSFHGGASAGMVLESGGVPGAADGPTDLIRRADVALNHAKRAGRGLARAFDATMDEGIRMRRRIEQGLERAIERGELRLVYQPIVGREALAIEGFEALVRWDGPEGEVSPATFIPIAEESNLIHSLGDWILATALAGVAGWPGQYVSINFSPRQFRRHDFVARIVAAAERAGVAPARVQIEITETAIFDESSRAAETLGALRRLGFRIALDDFGTGYSSLYNIRHFALDCLKIDRSFIEGMGRERESAAIVHAIIQLGRALGLGIIAEGVETEAQVQSLRVAGASHLQGFLFSHPVDAAAAAVLAQRGALTAAAAGPGPTHGPALTGSAPAA